MIFRLNRRVVGVASLVLFLLSIALLYNLIQPEKTHRILGKSGKSGEMTIKSPKEVAVHQPFIAEVEIDTKGNQINAAGVYLRYDPDLLQLNNMDTGSSFCQFYPEKRYDQKLGTITLACGSPHPGLVGQNTLIRLEFMPIKLGSTTILTSDETRLLLSDGKGDTNILDEFPTATIVILNTL